MKKKLLFGLLSILLTGFGYTVFYVNQYSIKDDRASISTDLTKWENRGNETEKEIKILEMTQIDHTTSYVVLFETAAKHVGYAHLLKGWNRQFKIEESGSGTNVVKYRNLNTNQGVYGILTGKNPDLRIDYITAKSEFTDEEFSFTSYIPQNSTFLVYKKLPDDLIETFLTLTLYDKNGKVIESPIEWSGK